MTPYNNYYGSMEYEPMPREKKKAITMLRMKWLKDNPDRTIADMADQMGISTDMVYRLLKRAGLKGMHAPSKHHSESRSAVKLLEGFDPLLNELLKVPFYDWGRVLSVQSSDVSISNRDNVINQ